MSETVAASILQALNAVAFAATVIATSRVARNFFLGALGGVVMEMLRIAVAIMRDVVDGVNLLSCASSTSRDLAPQPSSLRPPSSRPSVS